MIVNGDRREQISPLQFYLDQELAIPQADKIISLIVSARVTAVETLAGEAKVQYRVTYKTIFSGEDGIDCKEDSYDNNAVIKAASITPKSFINLTANIISNEYVGVGNIKVRSTVEIKGYVIVASSFELPDIPEGIFTKTAPVVVENIQPIYESAVVASEDFEIKEQVNKILTADTQIAVKRVSTATEICHIQGECYTYVTYIADGNLQSRCLTTYFDTEILAPNIKEGSEAFCSAEASNTSVTVLEGEPNAFRTEITIGVKGFCLLSEECEAVIDAYSKTEELDIQYNRVPIEKNVCLTGAEEKLSGGARLSDDSARVRSVLCVCPPSIGAISVSNAGGLAVEGIVTVSVIYLDENEEISQTLAELPYHFVLSRDFPCETGLSANAVVTSIAARARHNDEIEISASLYVEVYGTEVDDLKYVSRMEVLGSREVNECAISLYIVRGGESLWDVAKELMSDEDTLLQLNPDLALPLMGGEKVLLYRELT
ncbi:MAG: hypothetical protein WC292_00575 [Clostridia bacterium]